MRKGPIIITSRDVSPRVPDVLVPGVGAALDQLAEDMKCKRETLRNRNGQTDSGKMRYVGSIPMELFWGNAEFFNDDSKLRQWFKDNPAFCNRREFL